MVWKNRGRGRREKSMRKKIFVVAAAVTLGAAWMTTDAMALDQGAGVAKRSAHRVAPVVWYGNRYAWPGYGRALPFGPPLGALRSYGSGHSCNPYDPFTDLYGYCGGPYVYGW
jgi:hypothetical protein